MNRRPWRRRFAGLAVPVLAAITLFSAPAPAAPAHEDPVVATRNGPVRGVVSAAGIREFLAIPYATPPVGDLRWRPPVDPAPWSTVRDATEFGNRCPQLASAFGVPSTAEDCLFLNVFTPAKTGGQPLPVMVWIHGGSLLVGESDDYDPTPLVNDDIIVVTINYRLGALGWLAHSAFAAEITDPGHDGVPATGFAGNYGLMDQQTALRWVRDNIGLFGGDPGNVTIAGESAGGLSVFSLLQSPSAAGLFHKAIIESGAYALNTATLARAEATGATFANAVGCTDQTAACLRMVPVDTLLAAEAGNYEPNLDGSFLPISLGAALAAGTFNQVPVLQGNNHDEWRLFVALDFDLVGKPIPNTEAGYEAALATIFGSRASLVAAQYPLANFASASTAFAAPVTDFVYACPAYRSNISMSAFTPVSAYQFQDENAPEDFLPPVSFPYAAAHASELQYLFTLPVRVPRPALDGPQRHLSRDMKRYWTNFVKSGTPNGPGVPNWAPFNAVESNFQALMPSQPQPGSNFGALHHCDFWTTL